MRYLILLIFLLILPSSLVLAKMGKQSNGLSLYGNFNYTSDFKHFNYVNPSAPKGGKIRFATVGTFDNLNPFILKGIAAAGADLPFDSLLSPAMDEPDTAYGLIAKSVELADDRSWVRFVLNKKARWHDGTPITAEDIVFTFETLMEKGHPSYQLLFNDVIGVKKLSTYEVEFQIGNTDNHKLPMLIGTLNIISKNYYKKNDFNSTTLVPALGSGPYQIKSIDPGRRIVYGRVSDYWARDLPVNLGRHNFDEMTWDYYRDRTIMVEALKAGEFDWHEEFTSKTWKTAYNIPAVENKLMLQEVLRDNTPSGVQAFFINTRREKFKDTRVREALSLAFDYEWTNKNIFYGLYNRMASYFENSDLAARGLPTGDELDLLEIYRGEIPEEVFNRQFVPPKTDGTGRNRKNLRMAANLLKEADWQLVDGKRVHKISRKNLTLEILYFSPTFERVFGPFKSNLERLGITVSLRLVDPSQYIKRLETHDFDITTRRFIQQLSPGAELWNYFGSESADQPGTFNSSGINDPVVDDLILKVLSAKDRESMKVAARALDRVLLWGHYIIPQWFKGSHHLVYWNKFGKPKIVPTFSLGIDTWWLDTDKANILTEITNLEK